MFRDVILYDFDGNKILESPRMYIARAMDDIDLEFPYNPKKWGELWKTANQIRIILP